MLVRPICFTHVPGRVRIVLVGGVVELVSNLGNSDHRGHTPQMRRAATDRPFVLEQFSGAAARGRASSCAKRPPCLRQLSILPSSGGLRIS